jgi:hypothetical protein
LSDLQRGFTAAASFAVATFEAVRIAAESFAEVRGFIRDMDRDSRSFTVGHAGDPVTLYVGPNTEISLNDRPASFEDLRVGFRVLASYIEATNLALRVAASSHGEVTGHIRNIDGSDITITPLVDGPAVELHVTNLTAISVGGVRATLEDLREGMSVHATFDLATHEAFTIEARPLDGSEDCTLHRIRGVIGAVDPNGTVTIDPASGDVRVTLNVTPRTEIEVNGREARLSDLRPGMRVEASFCRQTLNAKHIAATSPTRER